MRTLSVIAALVLSGAGAVSHAEDRTFEKRVAADARGIVEVSNVAGVVNVVGWDRPEVEVQADLEEGVERVDVSTEGGRTLVKVVLPRESRRNDDADADLNVKVPRGSELTLVTVSADVGVKQVLGAQRLKTVSGSINTQVAGANAEINSVSGDIQVSGSGAPATQRFNTVSGNVTLEHGAGDVEATSVSGDVQVEVAPARSVRLRSTSGDLSFHGKLAGDGSLDAESMSGDVTLEAGGGYEYEASSFSGEVEGCFGKDAERAGAHAPGSRLNGKLGDGSARVRARTMSGDVSLCGE
jgi:DUF4097 and DUF4098 domain-containing protein YvlB